MAKKVVLQSVCDLCHEPGAVHTFRFGWMLTNYETDLCEAHAAEVTGLIERLVENAQRLGAAPKSVHVDAPPPPARSQVATAKVRAWAKKNGIEVSDRGRVPDEVFEQYLAATSAGSRSSAGD